MVFNHSHKATGGNNYGRVVVEWKEKAEFLFWFGIQNSVHNFTALSTPESETIFFSSKPGCYKQSLVNWNSQGTRH